MDATGFTSLIEAGEQLFVVKLFITAMHCLWVYDYFLTLGDEILYAWNRKRSWVFALFIAIRYSPVPYIIWFSILTYDYTPSLCQNTKWVMTSYTTLVAVLAEITIVLRVYAVTGKNKWLAGALSSLAAAQLVFGIYLAVWMAARPTQQLPPIDLDPFKFCVSQSWKLGVLLFINIAVAFDVLAFLSIFIAARKPRHLRHPGISSLLDTLLWDATTYFMLMALCQVSSDIFLSFAPNPVKAFPGLASTVLIPLMASRLMLSLTKTATEPTGVWSPSNPSMGTCVERRGLQFAPRVPGGSGWVPGTLTLPNMVEEDLELELTSQSSRNTDFNY